MSLSSISDKISQKLQENIYDKTRKQFITDLLELEVRYMSEHDGNKQESTNIKTIKKDFQYLMDQYYPVGEQNE